MNTTACFVISGKTPSVRQLLFRCCIEHHAVFQQSDAGLSFVHIRELEEIIRFRQAVGTNCHAVLVRWLASEQARGALGNRSDDSVDAYDYDGILLNDGTLDQLPQKIHAFWGRWINDAADTYKEQRGTTRIE